MKRILGIVILAAGFHITYGLLSIGETGNLRCYSMIPMVGGAALICLVVTVLCFWFLENPILRVGLSLLASYVAYILVLLIGSTVTGDLAETMMWFPLMLFFGIPNMLPLTIGTIIGVAMFSRRKADSAEQAG